MNNSMMRAVAVMLLLTASLTALAQSPKNSSYRKGYHADIAFEAMLASPGQIGLTTSHGYNWGRGLYVGGGAGFDVAFSDPGWGKTGVYLPVFADFKYSFKNGMFSPFIGVRGGGLVDLTDNGAGWFVSAAVGVDIWNFSLKLGYEIQSLTYRKISSTLGENHPKLSISYNF